MFVSRGLSLRAICFAALLFFAAAASADTGYVDGGGACNGLTPCFTTVQDAVDAATAPAQIFVFPGTYNESVNLFPIGGDVTLTTVDAQGAPTAHTATISSPGGPAIGFVVVDGPPEFEGDVTLEGFLTETTSFSCIELPAVSGDIVLREVTADGCASNGVFAEVVSVGNSITVEDSQANGNEDSGFALFHRQGGVGSQISVSGSTANNNEEGSGIEARGVGGPPPLVGDDEEDDLSPSVLGGGPPLLGVDIQVVGSTANGNDFDGFRLETGGDLVVLSCLADGNGEDGFDTDSLGDTTIRDCDALDNGSGDPESDDGFEIDANGSVVVENVVSVGNDAAGIEVDDEDDDVDSLSITLAEVSGSGGNGLDIDGLSAVGSHAVSCSDVSGNSPAGLELRSAVTLLAKGNWWGAVSGPTHPDNPGGTGDSIVDGDNGGEGTVEFVPFLTTPAGASCGSIQAIPTLDRWGLLALLCGMGLAGLWLMRRRQLA